jgi:hypothetical protein
MVLVSTSYMVAYMSKRHTLASALSNTSFGTPETFAFLTMVPRKTFSSGSAEPPAAMAYCGQLLHTLPQVQTVNALLAATRISYYGILSDAAELRKREWAYATGFAIYCGLLHILFALAFLDFGPLYELVSLMFFNSILFLLYYAQTTMLLTS